MVCYLEFKSCPFVFELSLFLIFLMYLHTEVLRRCEAMGFGPVTSVIMFTDEPDVPIPEYLLPLYGEYN